MMYAEPEAFEKEFIVRTKDIVHKYSGQYEITLFINTMLGLFIIPKEKRLDVITDSMIESSLLEKVKKCCKDKSKANPLSLQDVAKRIRNSIAHGHFLFEAEKDPSGKVGSDIIRISFYDDRFHRNKKDYNTYDFTAKFDVPTLKEFVFAFSDAIMSQIGDQT